VLAPHPRYRDLARRLRRAALRPSPWKGTFFRFTSARYAASDDLVSGEGSRVHGGRWNPPGSFAAVYGSLEPETATAESLALQRRYGVPDEWGMPRVLCAIETDVKSVLVLDEAACAKLGLELGELAREDWRAAEDLGRESLGRALGRAAHAAGFEGLLVPSAARRGARNLVVFPRALRPGSRLRARGLPAG